VCGETCDSCGDADAALIPTRAPVAVCSDSSESIFINRYIGHKTCDWLTQNPAFASFMCNPGYDAFHKCRDTCNNCDNNTRRTEEASPSSLTCEDSNDAETLVIEELEGPPRDCTWLGNNPDWQVALCHSDHGAWAICPEVCGTCSDNCDDDPAATFEFGEEGFRDCQWLSLRPEQAEQYCVESHPANEICRETCGTCQR
jgi:hypothetical protein